MKNSFFVAILLAGLFAVNPAFAYSMGLVSSNQSGVLPNNATGDWYDYNLKQHITHIEESYAGTLAAFTSIRFDFSVAADVLGLDSKVLKGTGAINADTRNYTAGTGAYYSAQTDASLTTGKYDTSTSGYNATGGVSPATGGYFSEALIVGTAVVDNPQHASITITNYSPVVASFLAYFQTKLGDLGLSSFVTSYKTTSLLSPVPVPAALPLFVLSLGVVALRRKKFI